MSLACPWTWTVATQRPPLCPGCGTTLAKFDLRWVRGVGFCRACAHLDRGTLKQILTMLEDPSMARWMVDRLGLWLWLPDYRDNYKPSVCEKLAEESVRYLHNGVM